ncbi:MAG TPA: MBL fold metallo-hydrolase [Planctomycetota bacterium]|nr:MBL fold metallo-hydrolase [Planctomycetota bacterium]
MAVSSRAVPGNADGDFFVDDTCIDCDTCRRIAPAVFADAGGHSVVRAQPVDARNLRAAARAALCCPTNSIGARAGGRAEVARAVDDFPLRVDGGVHECGFSSPKSYAGASWLIVRPQGNWLVDAPRWQPRLAERIAALGGLAGIFLTHRDDVADAAAYARRFACPRLIHARDRDAVPDAERVLDGDDAIALGDDLLVVPTPGHTAGHCVLLHADRHLFSGDHLWWDRDARRLDASRTHCWHSWRAQTASMDALLARRFSWVLPGHGDPVALPQARMREECAALVARMRAAP